MTSSTVKQIIEIQKYIQNKYTIHILPNISRKKRNQTNLVKFGQIWSVKRTLHEKYFFLKNHIQSVVEKLVPGPFLKSQN